VYWPPLRRTAASSNRELRLSDLVQSGLAALARQEPKAALECFRKAVEANPRDALALAWHGQTLCHLGNRAAGLPQLSEAARLMLDGPAVHPMIFETLAQMQQWGGFEQAVPVARALVARLPDDGRAHHLLGAICGQLNMTSEALGAVQRARELIHDSAMLEVLQASLEADARQHAGARDRLESLVERLADAVTRPGPDHVNQLRALFRALKELAAGISATGCATAATDHRHRRGDFQAAWRAPAATGGRPRTGIRAGLLPLRHHAGPAGVAHASRRVPLR
jgi:tetratricopeptide (TPR) repeat protein